MSKLIFSQSSTNLASKESTLTINGFSNGYKLVPGYANLNFDTAFNAAVVDRDLVTVQDIENNVNTLDAELTSRIDNIETEVLSESTLTTNAGTLSTVLENYGTFATNDQLGQYYGLNLKSTTNGTTYLTGFEIGQLTNTSGNSPINDSFFRIAADKFILGASVPATGGGTTFASIGAEDGAPTPVFATEYDSDTDQYNISFNGVVYFDNLVNGSGTTVVDGGKINTDFIEIGQGPAGGTSTVNKSIGRYPDEAQANAAVTLQGIVLSDGDSYFDIGLGVTQYWDDGSWVTTKGERGTVVTFIETANTTPTTGELDAAINTASGDVPKNGDSVVWTSTNASANPATATAIYNGSWVTNVVLNVHGDAVVDGTLSADKLVANTITADEIAAGSITFTEIDMAGEQGTTASNNTIYYDSVTDRLVLGNIVADSIEAGSAVVYSGTATELSNHLLEIIEGTTINTADGYVPLHVRAANVSGGAIHVSQGDSLFQDVYTSDIKGAAVSTLSNSSSVVASRLKLHGTAVSTNNSCVFVDPEYNSSSTNVGYVAGLEIGPVDFLQGLNTGMNVYSLYCAEDAYISGTLYPFTGAHIITMDSGSSYSIGDVLEDTGEVVHSDISNAIGTAVPTTYSKSKKVFGVYNGQGVNSLGEGLINICSQNGDIEVGDYICSSDIQGKGMKQGDDLLHNYTVAKARENVVWDELEVDDMYVYMIDGHKVCRVACTYHCG